MLKFDSSKRITASNCLKHPFFANVPAIPKDTKEIINTGNKQVHTPNIVSPTVSSRGNVPGLEPAKKPIAIGGRVVQALNSYGKDSEFGSSAAGGFGAESEYKDPFDNKDEHSDLFGSVVSLPKMTSQEADKVAPKPNIRVHRLQSKQSTSGLTRENRPG